jgi:hypothetical protein
MMTGFLLQVAFEVFKEYVRSVGYWYGLIIILLYVMYEACAVLANIFLSRWTDDPDLNNLTTFPANSSAREDRNAYYLTLYGGFGVAQSEISFKLRTQTSFLIHHG